MKIFTREALDECVVKLKSTSYDDVLSRIKNEDERFKINRWIRRKVDQFLSTSNMYQEEEFQLVLMWFYIQLKSEWSQLNTHGQYLQMKGYDIPGSLVYRLKVLSITIKEVEKFINIYHVDGVTGFLSLPMEVFESAPRYSD
ncbi:MAG: hypothetical protein JJ895_11265 [Balneolaceae bacterium]|nr:hypothetical protein [Balneolaceae bacterium]